MMIQLFTALYSEAMELKFVVLRSKTDQLKKRSPSTKILFSVGGQSHPAEPFSRLVSSETSKKKFIEHSITFLKENGFDGLDLFWYSPVRWEVGNPGSTIGHEQDKPNFQHFIEELREAYSSRDLLLTVQVSALKEVLHEAFDLEALSMNVDLINMVSWDLTGYWSGFTGYGNPVTTFDSDCFALVRQPIADSNCLTCDSI